MTRDHDILTTLRALDSADEHVDSRSTRARSDLARIMATDPSAPGSGGPSQGRRPSSSRSGDPRRTSTRARRGLLAGGVVTAVVTTWLLLPSMMGGDHAFATWSSTPEAMTAQERADAASECRDAQRSGPGGDYADELTRAEAVIAERRGAWVTVVMAGDDGFSAMCITDDSTRLFDDWIGSIGMVPDQRAVPAARDLIATDLGTGVIDAGQVSLAAGRAGANVVGVVYRSKEQGEVSATVSGGRFALWLPGDELEHAPNAGVEVEVTYRDGTTGTRSLHL